MYILQRRRIFFSLDNNNCEITQLTRGNCSACRLRKCFSFGMNPKLIRYKSKNHHQLLKNKKRLPKVSFFFLKFLFLPIKYSSFF